MSDDAMPLDARLKSWRLEKRTDDGDVYEVIEGDGDRAVVTFRRDGLAPAESYATGLPVDIDTKG